MASEANLKPQSISIKEETKWTEDTLELENKRLMKKMEELQALCERLSKEGQEKDTVLERLREEKMEVDANCRSQREKLCDTILKLARVTEAYQQVKKQMKRSVKGSLKNYLGKKNFELKLDVAVKWEKCLHMEKQIETWSEEASNCRKLLDERKATTDKLIGKAKHQQWDNEHKILQLSESHKKVLNRLQTSFGDSVWSFIGKKFRDDKKENSEQEQLRLQKKLLDDEQSRIERERKIQALKIARGEETCCIVCLDEEQLVNITFDPCGHNVCCLECSQQLKVCPKCRQTISKYIKTFN